MFRSHVGRGIDLSSTPNRLILGLSGAAAIAAVTLWATGQPIELLWAPVQVFLIWAIVREIDPDHNATALIAGAAAGAWVLLGLEFAGALPIGALLVAGRLVLNSTGRRPLITDLIAIAIGAAVVAFTTIGWVAGFGLAVAIYIDDRMAPKHTLAAAAAAASGALGASVVATASRAFPQEIPDFRPLLLIAIGLVGLIAVIREPEIPISQVDSRRKNFLEVRRLHAARSLIGVLVFAAAFFAGADALAMGPAAIGLVLALASNEIERIRRQ